MGIWVGIAIALFVIGSVMALKPSGVEVRLDKVRMTARALSLHPKLVQCPSWIRGKEMTYGKGMLGQYAVLLEHAKLPELRYVVIDEQLRVAMSEDSAAGVTSPESADATATAQSVPSVAWQLDKHPLSLPPAIRPLIKGVYMKSNHVMVYWQDDGYVKPNSNPHFSVDAIEPDLLQLKQWLTDLAASIESVQ